MPKKVSGHRNSSPTYHANVPHNIHAPIRHHATNTHNPHNKCNTRAKRQQQQTSACTTVKNNTIIPSTQNIEKIHATKQPHNRKTLRSFLKAVNAYKEFIPDHARLRTPLVNLLKKDVMWVWSDECQKAFTNLKESLTTHPTLYLYQEGLPCQVHCNTSTFGIAGILKQVYPDGKTYPVQHFSRSLRGHERNYSDLELQCLAIVESVDNFRACLMGRKFTILSDHPALQWLKEIKAPSGRLFRWRLRLSRYEYEVRSINGVQQYETGVGTRIPFCGFLDAPLIKSQQSSPPGKSRVTMDHNKLRTVSRKGVLKTIVPSSLTTRLLKSVHTQHHHPNISKMTRLISSQYYWQNMTQDIAKQRYHSLLNQPEPLEKNCILQFIPVHVGIGGNEMADEIAKEARNLSRRKEQISVFDADNLAKYKVIQPKIRRDQICGMNSERKLTKTITRLRTKHYKEMTIHPDGTRTYRTFNNCPGVELTPTHIFSCPAMALQKIDMDPEQQLYTHKIEDITTAVIEMHGDI
ncbi:K02A2.6-like [Cordylochernes scorpioides]|uniref:RNA-directed DNA polymerase n=1 Tax=Cordylochernes scorpioides TaxID=51811 RepID=A0ABY6KXS6_9ARAC|nr:K02A2.6-like [Cordylochernes scorpioides]